jgi:hypothetical protein
MLKRLQKTGEQDRAVRGAQRTPERRAWRHEMEMELLRFPGPGKRSGSNCGRLMAGATSLVAL